MVMYEREITKRLLKSGKISLFIDYYPPVWNSKRNVHTRWEFLKLYIYPDPKTAFEKKQNESKQGDRREDIFEENEIVNAG